MSYFDKKHTLFLSKNKLQNLSDFFLSFRKFFDIIHVYHIKYLAFLII